MKQLLDQCWTEIAQEVAKTFGQKIVELTLSFELYRIIAGVTDGTGSATRAGVQLVTGAARHGTALATRCAVNGALAAVTMVVSIFDIVQGAKSIKNKGDCRKVENAGRFIALYEITSRKNREFIDKLRL